jgi:hypothetical protein
LATEPFDVRRACLWQKDGGRRSPLREGLIDHRVRAASVRTRPRRGSDWAGSDHGQNAARIGNLLARLDESVRWVGISPESQ